MKSPPVTDQSAVKKIASDRHYDPKTVHLFVLVDLKPNLHAGYPAFRIHFYIYFWSDCQTPQSFQQKERKLKLSVKDCFNKIIN